AWLEEAHVRSSRVSDRYQWVRGYVLDAMVAVALDQRDYSAAGRLADTLAALAARGGMRELVVPAHLRAHPEEGRLADRAEAPPGS
ncbi:MAG TPA: hypothetical protein VJ140_16930, partial [Actinomycetota bacterium]|nr:hypothetical protein [Actinomycetota bacterium]